MTDLLENILNAGSDHLPMFGGRYEGGGYAQQIPEELAETLNYLANRSYENYLEIGAAAGGTARIIKEILRPQRVYVLDNNSHPKCQYRSQILPDAIEWIGNARSANVLMQLLQWKTKFDLVLFDAEPQYHAVFQYVWLVSPFLAENAILCFHDVFYAPGTFRLWNEFQLGLWPVKAERCIGKRLGIAIGLWCPERRQENINLSIITPVSRPQYLPIIDRFMEVSFSRIRPQWYVIADPICPELGCFKNATEVIIGGQSNTWGGAQRNIGLERVSTGWIYFLDDDNLPHPALEWVFLRCVKTMPHKKAWVFQQVDKDGNIRLRANPPVCIGNVDTGNVIIDRNFIGEVRWSYDYAADGKFWGRLYQKAPHLWGFVDIPCCFYNALR